MSVDIKRQIFQDADMQVLNTTFTSSDKRLYFLSGLVLLAGFGLSIISYLNICTSECAEVHFWRYWGFRFETIGLLFFPLLILAHSLSLTSSAMALLAGWMLAGAVGSEIYFIIVQKWKIGHWCPVCLSIAGTLFLAGMLYTLDYLSTLKIFIEERRKGDYMKKLWQGLSSLLIIIASFITAYFGVAKPDLLQAAENSIKDKIAFGTLNSKIQLYIFTDWECPACRQLEPALVRLSPELMNEAKVTFVDFAIHPETLNFTPYNLSFMVHDKDKYLQLRDVLTALSQETKEPTDEQVAKAIAPLDIKFQPLNYADVALGVKYFKHLVDQFDLDTTPTLVLVNLETKHGKKLIGREITHENIRAAIAAINKPKK